MVQRGSDLLSVEPRVQRDENSAELEDGVGESGKLGTVAEAHGHAVPLLDAKGAEGVGECIGRKIQSFIAKCYFQG